MALVIAVVAALSACATHGDKHGTISGSADLAAFFEIPSNAVFIAILEDTSAAAAQELGRARLEPAGQPPFHFEIDYDKGIIDPRHHYAVRGRLTSDERTLLVSEYAYPVLTQGSGDKVTMVLAVTPPQDARVPLQAPPAPRN